LNKDLTGVTAHWSRRKQSIVDIATVPLKVDPEGFVPPPEAKEVPEDKAINARALICGGIRKGPGHVYDRIDLLAQPNVAQGRGRFQAFGGLVKREAKDEKVAQSLAALVKAQCGVQLDAKQMKKVVEFHYDGRPPTVFFLPDISSAAEEGLLIKSVGTETTETVKVEEEYEEEEGEGEEKKTVKKKRTVEKEKTTYKDQVKPVVLSLQRLLQTPVDSEDIGHLELCGAADALEEWQRRDSARALIGKLEEKRTAALEAKAEEDKRKEIESERKRKRDEASEGCKKRRTDKEDELKKTWEAEDEGMTDDEKLAAKDARQALIKEIRDASNKELEEALSAIAEEEKAAAEAESKEAPVEEKPKMRKVEQCDEKLVNLLQTFDHHRSGETVDRNYLAACLLAADAGSQASLKKYRDLVTLGQTNTSPYLRYKAMATYYTEEPIPEEKKEEEKKEEEKEEEKKEDGDVKMAEEIQ